MARGRGARVSLFPFMSVLACTIGALILLLTSLALSAVAPRAPGADEAGTAAASVPDPVSRSADEEKGRIERLESLFARLDALTAPRESSDEQVDAEERLDDREADRARAARRLVADRTALAARRAEFERERATIEAEIEVLESRRATLPILIDPTGLSRRFDPWFVECDGRGATLHNVDDGFSLFVPRDELSLSSELPRYLRRLRAMPGSLLVLLIRAEGLSSAAATSEVARSLNVRVAELPLPGSGVIDWALLRERRAEARR